MKQTRVSAFRSLTISQGRYTINKEYNKLVKDRMHIVFWKEVSAMEERSRSGQGNWVGMGRASCSIKWDDQGTSPRAEETFTISKVSCLHSLSPLLTSHLFLSPGKSAP